MGGDAHAAAQRQILAEDGLETTWLQVIPEANAGPLAVWVDAGSGPADL